MIGRIALLPVVIAFLLGLAIVVGLRYGSRLDGEPLDAVSTSEPSPSTTWLETQPTLGDGFDELLAGVARARHRVVRRGLFRAAMAAPSRSGGYECGGDLPDCSVLEHESLMTADPPRAWNGVNPDTGETGCYYPAGYTGENRCGSTASGLWQFLRSTWDNFGGYLNAADAPVDVQNAKARLMWNHGRGCAHWNACR